MPVVKLDEKGRIQLPKTFRKELHLRPRQPLVVKKQGELLTVSKVTKVSPNEDPLLRDIILNPLKSKKKVTKELLEELKDEMWSE